MPSFLLSALLAGGSTASADQPHVVPALHCVATTGTAGYGNANIYNTGTSTGYVNCPLDQLVESGEIDPDTAIFYAVDQGSSSDVTCALWSALYLVGTSTATSSYYSTSYSGSTTGASTKVQAISIPITTAEEWAVDTTWGSTQFRACSLPGASTAAKRSALLSYSWIEIPD